MGMRSQPQGQRMVYDTSHYVGQIRRRINDINNETNKLRQEAEQITKDNSQYSSYEKKYEALLKSKDQLEGQLADYNLAMDKTRTSTDADEVQKLAYHLNEKNRQASQELDRVFMVRKQREQDVSAVEEQLDAHYRAIQARINELEPGKLRAYNELMAKQKDYQEKVSNCEHKLSDINGRMRQLEGDDHNSSLKKEYAALEKQLQSKRKDLTTFQEELDIVSLEPKEAHSKYVARVQDFKQVLRPSSVFPFRCFMFCVCCVGCQVCGGASEAAGGGDRASQEAVGRAEQCQHRLVRRGCGQVRAAAEEG